MFDKNIEVITKFVNGNDVRTVTIENEVYVALPDYINQIKNAVDSIVRLSREQEDQVESMSTLMKAFHEVLEEQYPEILEELTTLIHKKIHAV